MYALADLLAVWLGKLTLLGLRLLGRRGNALPGLVVEKLVPGYLPRAMARLAEGVVVVTGTNGKTTTTKMLATILAERYRVLTNDTGSNFVRGAITATVERASWGGRLPFDVAVFELDEAWAVRFVKAVPPRRALLLNVKRDQHDRFGEIDATAALLGAVASATTGHLALNRDDPRVAALGRQTKAEVRYYGVLPPLRPLFPTDEELYGGAVQIFDQPATVELAELPEGAEENTLLLVDGRARPVRLRAAGAHNAQNAAGALALALSFDGLDTETALAGLAKVSPAFGRGERMQIDGRVLVLHLVKNPAGFRQSLRTLDTADPPAAVVIAINDEYADGRDVSWLWDVDFTALAAFPGRLCTSGTRAADMALRLHYDGVEVSVDGGVEPDLVRSVRAALDAVPAGGRLEVFSTYTAMWSLHSALSTFPGRDSAGFAALKGGKRG
jgi:UDP-N-acetylmuramyl tripeptide synthase